MVKYCSPEQNMCLVNPVHTQYKFVAENMPSRTNISSNSFLFKSLRRLYTFAQLFDCASFSYSTEIGVHIKPINKVTFVLSCLFYNSLSYINMTTDLTINADGYQAILFYVGMRVCVYYGPAAWSLSIYLFLARRKIAQLMEDIMALNSEV